MNRFELLTRSQRAATGQPLEFSSSSLAGDSLVWVAFYLFSMGEMPLQNSTFRLKG